MEVTGEKPIISTRKALQKEKADEILNDSDPDFSGNHGWTSEELNTIDVTKTEALKKYLVMAQADISSVEVPPVTDAELEDIGMQRSPKNVETVHTKILAFWG